MLFSRGPPGHHVWLGMDFLLTCCEPDPDGWREGQASSFSNTNAQGSHLACPELLQRRDNSHMTCVFQTVRELNSVERERCKGETAEMAEHGPRMSVS